MGIRTLLLRMCLAVSMPALGQYLEKLPPSLDVITIQSWRVHDGDNLAWAQPDCNDAGWASVPFPARSSGSNELQGFHWYRTMVSIPPSWRVRDLAVSIGPLDEVYEVYAEGVLVGRFGRWEPLPESTFSRNLSFPIPSNRIHGPSIHIAIRRWNGGSTTNNFLFSSTGASHFDHLAEVGLAPTIDLRATLFAANGVERNLPWNIGLLLLLGAGCVAFVLFSAQRQRKEYLLLGIFCTGSALCPFAGGILASSEVVMRRSLGPFLVYVTFAFVLAAGPLFLSRICSRFRRWLELGAVINFLSVVIGALAFVSQSTLLDRIFWQFAFYPSLMWPLLAAIGLLLERKPGSIAIALSILPVQLSGIWVSLISGQLHLPSLQFMQVGAFVIDIRSIGDVVFVFTTLTVLYLRFRDEQVRTLGLEQDMASARRMQERLLADTGESPAGFAVAAVYRPAKEVGGDFYKTELLEDGSLLIVVGDVSGKGLDAALLVAAVLGGLAVDLERRPGVLLEDLNKAVLGRTGVGFITACCARLYPDGRLIAANAGHLSPYFDGKELPVEAGLPLGITTGVAYSESCFETRCGTVTWLSDGVLEARNREGELLGFERMAALTVNPAEEIADAAQRWGQEDDITVLTVKTVTNCA